MASDLSGKVALVTGASRGIGRAISETLVRAGAKVFGTARDGAALQKVAAALGGNFAWEAGDLRDAPFCSSLAGRCAQRWGKLDILVNNAGINRVAKIEDLPLEEWEEVLRVNLTAPFLLTKAALPHLEKAKGVIINVSSVSAKVGLEKFPGFAAYCASKYGLQGLTDVTHVEAYAKGVRVYALQPASTDTQLLRATIPGAKEILPPTRVAEVALDLATGRLAKSSGSTVEIWP
ncbi:MAG: SDR family oxidoreductase [Bdellovibrionota bacterium]